MAETHPRDWLAELRAACDDIREALKPKKGETSGREVGLAFTRAERRLLAATFGLVGDKNASDIAVQWLGEPRMVSLDRLSAPHDPYVVDRQFAAAIAFVEDNQVSEQEGVERLTGTTEALRDLIETAVEAGSHLDGKVHEAMLERAVAEVRDTPGMEMRVTEVGPSDEIIRDEQVFGPERGLEGMPVRDRRTPADVKSVLGLDTATTGAAWQSLCAEQGPAVLGLLGLGATADSEDVRLAMARRMLDRGSEDSAIGQRSGVISVLSGRCVRGTGPASGRS